MSHFSIRSSVMRTEVSAGRESHDGYCKWEKVAHFREARSKSREKICWGYFNNLASVHGLPFILCLEYSTKMKAREKTERTRGKSLMSQVIMDPLTQFPTNVLSRVDTGQSIL